jgi:excisionase family DNA binding protein
MDKRVLSFEEGCAYLGYKKSYVYKLISAGKLPYSKPNGKKIYFDRLKLEEWMLSNPYDVNMNDLVSEYLTRRSM